MLTEIALLGEGQFSFRSEGLGVREEVDFCLLAAAPFRDWGRRVPYWTDHDGVPGPMGETLRMDFEGCIV